jgi:Fic family protein
VAKPARAAAKPAKAAPKPAKVAPKPEKVAVKPAKVAPKPEKAAAKPEKVAAKPAKALAKAAERPVEKAGRAGDAKGGAGRDAVRLKKIPEGKRRILPVREQAPRVVTLPLPMLPPIRRPSVEERSAVIEKRLDAQSEDFRKRYIDSFDMSWIYHDSALEGVVYTFEELRGALGPQPVPITDSSLQPTYDDIKRHKEAIEYVRDFAIKKRLPVTVDVIKKIYLILHPEEGDIKTVKYRKDIPQHRLYFHEYAPPDKIAYKVRQVVDWLNDPETRKTRNGVRIAARAHYDLLRVYPFPTDSGKVSRLFMNLLLMRSGLPPSIIHSTERQRYYEALKGSATTVLQMVQESVENALSSVEKLLNEHETRKRAFVS